MTIKKAYADIISYLEANMEQTVADVLPTVVSMASAKVGGGKSSSNHAVDADGNPIYIFCYYHKKWEPLAEIEYGTKKGTSTGFNTMCKEGVSQWTRQNNAAKQAAANLLKQVANGEVSPAEIPAKQAEIEAERAQILPHSSGIGFDELPADVEAFVE
jgi:hypothetical protein